MSDSVLMPMLGDYRPSLLPTKFFLSTEDSLLSTLSPDYLKQFFNYSVSDPSEIPPFIEGDHIEIGTLNNGDIGCTSGVIKYTSNNNSYTIQPTETLMTGFGKKYTCYTKPLVINGGDPQLASTYNSVAPFTTIGFLGFQLSNETIDFIRENATIPFQCTFNIMTGGGGGTVIWSGGLMVKDLRTYFIVPVGNSGFSSSDSLVVNFNVGDMTLSSNTIISDLWMGYS